MCRYNKPEDFEIVQVPLPLLRDDDVLVKVKACGVCGTGMQTPTPLLNKSTCSFSVTDHILQIWYDARLPEEVHQRANVVHSAHPRRRIHRRVSPYPRPRNCRRRGCCRLQGGGL